MKCRKCHAEIPDGSRFCCACGLRQDLRQNPKRRGNGTGTVFQRPNKTWVAMRVVRYDPLPGGKLKKITRSKSGFKTKKEALEYLPFLGTEPPKKALTFLQVYDAWEPTHQAGKSTMDCYRAAKKWFRPVWPRKFRDLSLDDLQECLDECEKGKRTRQNMKALAGLLYKYAIPRKLADLNLGPYLKVTGENSDGKAALPEEAVEAIRAAVGTVPGADYVLCQCYLGFRPSEFITLDAIHYNRKEKAFVGGAKTDAGKDRVVTVSPKIQPIVSRLVKDKVAGPVFCADGGRQMTIKEYRALFYSVLEACKIDNPVTERDGGKYHLYTPHSCRHTFATLMKRVPGASKDKLELMGHTSEEMLRHYQDVSYEDLRRVTDAI